MLVGDLQVVLRRGWLLVANQLEDDARGEVFGEFRLPRAGILLNIPLTACSGKARELAAFERGR